MEAETGTVQLRLTASRQPGETLYLRGFAGGTYGDSHWEAADDRSLFLDISDEMGRGSWGTWLNGVFSSMYFMLNSTAEAEGRAEPVSLNIQHTAGGIRPLYTPYYSRWDYQRDYQQDGASEQAAARLPGYSFQYYEQQDMDVDWTRQTREMEESAEWFRQIQDIYMEEIQTVYTQVPKEEVRSLAALCREHPASDLADATSVILSVLENSTSYTLTPGSAPVNTDIVEYFLFDSQEGYCVHYASAATLMYRLYGIPARYGAGYAVQPSDFVLQEDGTWVAEVTDESVHAWTEIFLEDYGWTPVEVTPASDGSMLASYPGFDAAAAVLPQVRVDRLSERGRDGEETAEGEPGADENENEDGAGEGLLSGLVSGASERQVWAVCGAACAALVLLLLLLPLLVDYRRLRRLRRLEQSRAVELFAVFMDMLHFAGYMEGYEGAEKDFGAELARQVACISREEALALEQAAGRAAFAAEGAAPEDRVFMLALFARAAEHVYSSLGRGRRLLFKYVKCWI